MENKTTTCSKSDAEEYQFLKKTTNVLLLLIVMLVVVNLILNQIITFEDYHLLNSDGLTMSADEFRKKNILNILLIIPVLGFAVGSIMSFIPFKRMGYKRKYLRFSLAIIVVLYVTQFVSYLNQI